MTKVIEVQDAQRAWAESQRLLGVSAVPRETLGYFDVGWYEGTAHPAVGAFAVFRAGGAFTDFAGDILRLSVGSREAFVYVYGAADVPDDLALSRVAFIRLGPLAQDTMELLVEVM